MEKVLERLPNLLASDEDSDDSGDKSTAIFNRSAHLKSLGVELTEPSSTVEETIENKNECTSLTEKTNILKASSISQTDSKKLSVNNDIINSVNDDQDDWAKFKSEFSESLQASEETVTSLGNGDLPLHDLKQQLLVSAILAMHDNTEAPDVNTASTEISKSPSKVRRRLVSLNSLETIHESEIDKLLEGSNLLPEDKSTAADDVQDNLTRPSAPRLVWEKEDTSQLLRDLGKISKATSTDSIPTVSTCTNDWRNPSSTGVRTVKENKDKGPIFLDLRPGPDKNKAVRQTERSTSDDDDDSDDPYAWITQRKHIKHALSTSHPLTTDSSQSHQPSLKMTTQSPQEQKVENSITQPLPTDSSIKNTGMSISSRVKTKPINTPAITPRHTNGQPSETTNFKRQHNSSSLTLSSSLSDGEANVFEMPGVNESKLRLINNTKSSPASSPTKAKKSKKQSKKSAKKSRKDKDTSAPKKDPAKSAQRKLARALVLERVRKDSLTTSSDEEHCLTPSETGSSKLSSSLSSCDTIAHQESEEDFVMDTEKLKLQLKKIIHAKKPPAQFVTPGTSTVFHEEVSFEPQPSSIDPAHSTDAMLVFPLSEHGLISLPTEIEEEAEVNLQIQLCLHLLILTWLSGQAATNYTNTVKTSESNDLVLQELEDDSMPIERDDRVHCHFHITGLLQTILDGRPSLLVGVSVDEGLKSSSEKQGKWFQVNQESELINTLSSKLTTRLHGLSLNKAMQSVISNDQVQTLIDDQVLENLEQIGQLPLTSFLSVQEDTTPLTTLLSFYWHSGYHISSLPSNESLRSQSPVSTTVTTLSGSSLANYPLVFTTLQSAYDNAFYLAGLRTIYTREKNETSSEEGLTMALALRGSDSIYRWLDIVGPEDRNLAKITDPDSLNSKFGDPQISTLQCVRTPYLITSTIAKWFGGRACLKTGSVLGISDPRTKFERRKRQRVRFSESESEDGLPPPSPDVTFPPLVSNRPGLVAQPYTKVLLTVAPLVPPSLYGSVLSTCNKMGFDVLGMKRIRLNSKRAGAMHIPKQFFSNFTPSSTPPSPAGDFVTHPLAAEYTHTTPPFPSLILYLGSENGKLHSLALLRAICLDLGTIMKANGFQGTTLSLSNPDSFLFTTEMSQEISKVLGSFNLSSAVSGSLPKLHEQRKCSGQFAEELCFVAVPQCNSLPKLFNFLNSVYQLRCPITEQSTFEQVTTHSEPSSNQHEKELGGFELLGFKIIPLIPRFHAKRLCPLANTDSSYQTAVTILSDSPASLLLFRGLDCNSRLSALIKPPRPRNSLHTNSVQQQLDIIISRDFEEAFNLSSIFFSDKEMFNDSSDHNLALCMPPSWQQDSCILQDLQAAPAPLLSVVRVRLSESKVLVKVLDRLWRAGFKFAAMRTVEVKSFIKDLKGSNESVEDGVSEAYLVVCVMRLNAVWQLKHCLSTLMGRSTTVGSSTIQCADSFFAAIAQVRQYFPEGICCEVPASSAECKVQSETSDLFDGLVLPERCLCSPSSSLLGYTSPLLETTVMVLPPSLLDSSHPSTSGCVEIIDFLTQSGFEIQGLKMATFSPDLARELLALYDCEDSVSVDELNNAPCLVLVVRRDNAASCCQSIFKSALLRSYRPGQGSFEKLLSQLIVPNNAQQAKGALRLFKVNP